jgi:hypothetical protein
MRFNSGREFLSLHITESYKAGHFKLNYPTDWQYADARELSEFCFIFIK